MCGIVGFVGGEEAAPILLDGLARLEYRGYDSAGIAVYDAGFGLQVYKAKGRLQALSDLVAGGANVHGSIGIGHTRWATHGQPSDRNSHPHVSESGRIAVVHNGIIENYLTLRQRLQDLGVHFVSETDTEVVAQLVDYYYKGGNLMEAVTKALSLVEGSYALGIICVDYPDQIIAARKGGPLVLGYAEGRNFLASDVTAIIKYTRDVVYMEDGEIAVLTANGISVYDNMLNLLDKQHSTVDWEVSAAEKGGYEHFMIKEIMEQPEALRKCLFPRIRSSRVVLDDLQLDEDYIRSLNKFYIVACGSSYHVGMVAKYFLERMLRIPVEVALASEFRYCHPIADEKTLAIVISQSGETADTLEALREAKRLGARTLGVVNVVGSTIAKECDDVLYTWAGPEIAVATTKAYSTQLGVLYLLGLWFADALGCIEPERYTDLVNELLLLPSALESVLEQCDNIKYLASRYFNHSSIFFIGRNVDYAIGLEGSLKLKEISYIHSEAYAAGELKHGTISLIENGTLVVAIATYADLFDKTVSNLVEVQARGADVIALTTGVDAEKLARLETPCAGIISVPDLDPMLLPSLAVVPLQLFAYYVALNRGCDIDKPRNLAKSVTVE